MFSGYQPQQTKYNMSIKEIYLNKEFMKLRLPVVEEQIKFMIDMGKQILRTKIMDNDIENHIFDYFVYIIKKSTYDKFKIISLRDVVIPNLDYNSYCGKLRLIKGKLMNEHGITDISFSIPPDAMGNRPCYNEKIECSEIMLFKNDEGYYDHPICYGDAIYRFYDEKDNSGLDKFIEWLYEYNYIIT